MTQRKAIGASTLLQRARPDTLGLVVAKHGVLSLLLFGPPLVWSAIEGAYALALALVLPMLAGGASATLTWRRSLPGRIGWGRGHGRHCSLVFARSCLCNPGLHGARVAT